MSKAEKDQEREERIAMEAIVDAYGAEEQAMGWYCYLADKINFPFKARCIKKRRTSPLQLRDEIKVLKIAPEDDCSHEMFVEIRWSGRRLAIPLVQIEPIEADDGTQEAIEDWHYWMAQGYELG